MFFFVFLAGHGTPVCHDLLKADTHKLHLLTQKTPFKRRAKEVPPGYLLRFQWTFQMHEALWFCNLSVHSSSWQCSDLRLRTDDAYLDSCRSTGMCLEMRFFISCQNLSRSFRDSKHCIQWRSFDLKMIPCDIRSVSIPAKCLPCGSFSRAAVPLYQTGMGKYSSFLSWSNMMSFTSWLRLGGRHLALRCQQPGASLPHAECHLADIHGLCVLGSWNGFSPQNDTLLGGTVDGSENWGAPITGFFTSQVVNLWVLSMDVFGWDFWEKHPRPAHHPTPCFCLHKVVQ